MTPLQFVTPAASVPLAGVIVGEDVSEVIAFCAVNVAPGPV